MLKVTFGLGNRSTGLSSSFISPYLNRVPTPMSSHRRVRVCRCRKTIVYRNGTGEGGPSDDLNPYSDSGRCGPPESVPSLSFLLALHGLMVGVECRDSLSLLPPPYSPRPSPQVCPHPSTHFDPFPSVRVPLFSTGLLSDDGSTSGGTPTGRRKIQNSTLKILPITSPPDLDRVRSRVLG